MLRVSRYPVGPSLYFLRPVGKEIPWQNQSISSSLWLESPKWDQVENIGKGKSQLTPAGQGDSSQIQRRGGLGCSACLSEAVTVNFSSLNSKWDLLPILWGPNYSPSPLGGPEIIHNEQPLTFTLDFLSSSANTLKTAHPYSIVHSYSPNCINTFHQLRQNIKTIFKIEKRLRWKGELFNRRILSNTVYGSGWQITVEEPNWTQCLYLFGF